MKAHRAAGRVFKLPVTTKHVGASFKLAPTPVAIVRGACGVYVMGNWYIADESIEKSNDSAAATPGESTAFLRLES